MISVFFFFGFLIICVCVCVCVCGAVIFPLPPPFLLSLIVPVGFVPPFRKWSEIVFECGNSENGSSSFHLLNRIAELLVNQSIH